MTVCRPKRPEIGSVFFPLRRFELSELKEGFFSCELFTLIVSLWEFLHISDLAIAPLGLTRSIT